MNWLNLDLTHLRKWEFVGADEEQRGVWLSIISWCATVENGGKIIGARYWTAEMWLQSCSVRLKKLRGACGLWSWEGDDLVIWNYPIGKETQVKVGRSEGPKGGRPKNANPSPNPSDNPKGRERKGKELEGEGNGSDPPALEFPAGFPVSGAQAVAWVRSGMLAATAPDEAIVETWTKIVGQGFRSGNGQRVENWAMWFHSFWQRAGGSWLEDRARRTAAAGAVGEKKEEPAVKRFKTPVWPWRLVARRLLEWVYAPEIQWQDLDLDSRRQIKGAWDELTPEKQAEFLNDAREGHAE